MIQARPKIQDSPNTKLINKQKDIIGAIKTNNKIIESINTALLEPNLDEKQKAELTAKKDYLSSKNADYVNYPTWSNDLQTGEEIRAELEEAGWSFKNYGKYAPKLPETPKVTPTVGNPSSNMIDPNDENALNAALKAQQAKRFEQSRQQSIKWGKENSNGYYLPRY